MAVNEKGMFYTEVDLDSCSCPSGDDGITIPSSLQAGTYYFAVHCRADYTNTVHISVTCGLGCPEPDCNGCLPSFMPEVGEDYLVTAWVHKENAPLGTIDFGDPVAESPSIRVEAPIGTPLVSFFPTMDQPVIEGWQLIEGSFTMPSSPSFGITLIVGQGSALFDDVRILPADGSMKCYVYDPENLRFLAELDERHFATFYEYDNEGKLVRVKKETERGIMTIQESRQNASHIQP